MSFYYNVSKHNEEKAIRRFEVNESNLEDSDHLKKFSWIYPIICLNAKPTNEKIEDIFKENFNPKILELIKRDYFNIKVEKEKENESENEEEKEKEKEKEKKNYDIRKIKLLIFLLTTNSSDNENSDKVKIKLIFIIYFYHYFYFILIFIFN